MKLESSGTTITADAIKSKLLDLECNAKSSKNFFFRKGGKHSKNTVETVAIFQRIAQIEVTMAKNLILATAESRSH